MAKLPFCKGNYFKSGTRGKWYVKISCGWNEKKKRYESYTEKFDTQADAIVALKEINEYLYFGGEKDKEHIRMHRRAREYEEYKNKMENNKKGIKRDDSITFNQFALQFAEIKKGQGQVSNRTINGYQNVIYCVQAYIGNLPLSSITALDIDRMYQLMRDPKHNLNKSGKAYSGTTLSKVHEVLRLIFKQAQKWGKIDKNPIDDATRPKRDTKEKEALSLEQAQNLCEQIVSEELNRGSVGLLIGLMCGVRISEMLCITWEKFDKKNKTLLINESLEKDSQATKCPKNGESRTLTCPQVLYDVLLEWQTIQKAYFKQVGLIWKPSVPIVHNEVGIYWYQSNYRRWLRANIKHYNLPDGFHYHELRHTYTTLLYRNCATDERTARELTGHKSAEAFAGYTHTSEEWKRKSTDKLNNLLTSELQCSNCSNCKYFSPAPAGKMGTCWLDSQPKTTNTTDTCQKYLTV